MLHPYCTILYLERVFSMMPYLWCFSVPFKDFLEKIFPFRPSFGLLVRKSFLYASFFVLATCLLIIIHVELHHGFVFTLTWNNSIQIAAPYRTEFKVYPPCGISHVGWLTGSILIKGIESNLIYLLFQESSCGSVWAPCLSE